MAERRAAAQRDEGSEDDWKTGTDLGCDWTYIRYLDWVVAHSMSHKDRNHVQVPKELPPWLDGPKVRAEAKRLGISKKQVKVKLMHEFITRRV